MSLSHRGSWICLVGPAGEPFRPSNIRIFDQICVTESSLPFGLLGVIYHFVSHVSLILFFFCFFFLLDSVFVVVAAAVVLCFEPCKYIVEGNKPYKSVCFMMLINFWTLGDQNCGSFADDYHLRLGVIFLISFGFILCCCCCCSF